MRIEGMNEETYHTSLGYGSSALKAAYASPMAFQHHIKMPEFMKRKSSAFSFGSAFHRMLLEPERFEREYVLAQTPFPNYTLKAAREYLRDLEEQFPGRTIIKAEDAFKLTCMRNSALNVPPIAEILTGHKAEVSYFIPRGDLRDSYHAKARFDIENERLGVFADLKTIDSLSERSITSAAISYCYDIQQAHYLDVAKAVNPDTRDWEFRFIFVEKNYPFNSVLVVLNFGTERFEQAVKHLREALLYSSYEPRFPHMLTITKPDWM